MGELFFTYRVAVVCHERGKPPFGPSSLAIGSTPEKAAKRLLGEDLIRNGKPENLRAKVWRTDADGKLVISLLYRGIRG